MKGHRRRRNYYIKRRFQANFTVYFVILVIMEAILIGALFMHASRGTLTTAYSQGEILVCNTRSFFMGNFILMSAVVTLLMGITAFAVFIYLTHRLAGPLYRFERSLEEVARGDLSHRINTRKNDELKELEKSLNSMVKDFDARLSSIKSDLHRLEQIAAKGSLEGERLKESVQRLKDKVAHFKTTL